MKRGRYAVLATSDLSGDVITYGTTIEVCVRRASKLIAEALAEVMTLDDSNEKVINVTYEITATPKGDVDANAALENRYSQHVYDR